MAWGSVFGRQEVNEMMHTCFAEDGKRRRWHSIPFRSSAAVLLLGATGLNGAHLLRYLIKSGKPKVRWVGREREGGRTDDSKQSHPSVAA